MTNNSNNYIRKMKRKRVFKKLTILFVLIVLVAIFIILKTDIFLIKDTQLKGTYIITNEYVSSIVEGKIGENLVSLKSNDLKKELLKNPYIESVKISKKIPGTLTVEVQEKSGIYYVSSEGGYTIVSKDLYILEKSDTIENKAAIEVIGLNVEEVAVGEKLEEGNTRIEKVLEIFYKAEEKMRNDNIQVNISKINIEDMSNIRIFYNDIEVYLGNDENLTKKMSDALKIYLDEEIKPTEYIKVNHNGSPDIK